MTGIAAIALCAAMTSCSKGDVYDEGAVREREEAQEQERITNNIEQAKSNYATAFENAFGPVGANVDWGFSSSNAGTRYAAVNSNQWFDGVTEQFKHLVKPADVTAREEEVVSEWFKTNKNPTCDEILLTEFFVQQVYFGTKEYTAKDHNNAEHKVIGGQHMDYLYAGTVDNKDHINNFNTSAPKRTDTGLQNMQLMQESSTANFGYHESYNSQNDRYYLVKNRNWVIKAISVDGVIGYYVGFDYESHGNQGDFEPDGYFDDRIIKIVPGTGYNVPAPLYRVIAEDLNAYQASDFDFNDVVFDVVKVENGNTTLKLIACGGIYKLTVGGVEVHGLFGQSEPDENGLYSMFNTGAGASHDPVEFEINGTYETPEQIKNIVIKVWKPGTGDDGVELTAERGVAACKILVDDRFTVVPERHSIADANGNFTTYVRGNWSSENEKFWWVQE